MNTVKYKNVIADLLEIDAKTPIEQLNMNQSTIWQRNRTRFDIQLVFKEYLLSI